MMGLSPGDTLSSGISIEGLAPQRLGALALGPVYLATAPERQSLWLTTVPRSLVPRARDQAQFVAQARAMTQVQLPGLCELWGVEPEGDGYVVGYHAVTRAVPLSQVTDRAQAPRVAWNVAGALAQLHQRGWIHGLLTPGNIVLDPASAQPTWWIWQHGVAGWCVADRLAARMRPFGGDAVAPEVRVAGATSPSADVYAWAVAIAGLLTGATGQEAVAAMAALEEPTPLAELVRECLSYEPEDRPVDGMALVRRLRDVVDADDEASLIPESTGPAEATGSVGFAQDTPSFDFGSGAFDLPTGITDLAALGATLGSASSGGAAANSDAGAASPWDHLEEAALVGTGHRVDPDITPIGPPSRANGKQRRLGKVADEKAGSDHGSPWRDLAESYLEEDPGGAPEPLSVAPPKAGEALARLSLVRTRVPAAADRLVTAAQGSTTGQFEIPDTPAPEPDPLPQSIPEAPPLPLGGGVEGAFAWEGANESFSAMEIQHPALAGQWDNGALPEDASWGDDRLGRTPVDGYAPPRGIVKIDAELAASLAAPVLQTLDGAEGDASVDGGTTEDSTAKPPALPAEGQVEPGAASVPFVGSGITLAVRAAPKSEKGAEPSSEGVQPGTDTPAQPPRTPGPKPARALEGAGSIVPVYRKPVESEASAVRESPSLGEPPPPLPSPVARGSGGWAPLVGLLAVLVGVGWWLRTRGAEPAEQDSASRLGQDGAEKAPPPPPVSRKPQAVVAAPTSPCPPEMVLIPGLDACIDQGEFPGLRQVPTTQKTQAEAQAACAARGQRLCSEAEWKAACRGPSRWRHPYGAEPELEGCNTASASGAPQNLSRSGARDRCVTPQGVFDLEGNVAEWVSGRGQVLGGDSETREPSCESARKLSASARKPTVGWRCCADRVPPASGAGSGPS